MKFPSLCRYRLSTSVPVEQAAGLAEVEQEPVRLCVPARERATTSGCDLRVADKYLFAA